MSPLAEMVGSNGLYVSAETFNTLRTSASVPDTVYDDLTLQLAGKPAPAMWKTPAGAAALRTFAQQHPVWGQWFVFMAERASGASSGLLDARSLLPLFHEAGYFAEPRDKVADPAGEVAETQAALQVLTASGLHLSDHDAALADHWLSGQATRIQYPVQACTLTEAFASLKAPAPPGLTAYAGTWLNAHATTGLHDSMALPDTYGAVCAAKPSAATGKQLFATLAPYADRPGESTSLQRFQLAQTLLALGADVSRLSALSTVARSDLDSRGLARGNYTLQGGLLPTYFATTIEHRLGRAPGLSDPTAVSKALKSVDPGTDPIDYLAATATLCEIQGCRTDQTALAKAVAALPRHIGVNDVQTYVDAAQILGTLGMSYPAVTVDRFDGSSDRGLFGLLLLARAGSAAAAGQLSTAEITAAWRAHGSAWSLTEVNAMVLVLNARHALSHELSAAVQDRYVHSRGCAGLGVLYATDAGSQDSTCDLATTLDAMQATGYVSQAA